MYKLLISNDRIKTELYIDTFPEVLIEHCKASIGKYKIYATQLLPWERNILKDVISTMEQYRECQNVSTAISKMLCDYIDRPEIMHDSNHWIVLISVYLINNG